MYQFERPEAEKRIATNAAAMIDEMAGGHTFVLNLGVGIPSLISSYIKNENVYIEAENGMLGVGPHATREDRDWNIINAGRQIVLETPGCCYLSSEDSFGMMRGGHMDATVLGAFSVDKDAHISNWIIPGGEQLGVGGAMDLVTGCKKVIVAMTHRHKDGSSRLIKRYILPVTGFFEVDYVVTEYCMMRHEDNRFVCFAIAEEITLDELRSVTEFDFDVDPDLRIMLK